jgi:hypothetical protein
MSYLEAADLYLGDVSSQVSEFVCRPRPCLFLNAHRVAWQGNPDYRFWSLGPVVDQVADLPEKLAEAFARHAEFVDAQRAYFADTFGLTDGQPSAARGADAIVAYLAGSGSTPWASRP